MMIHALFLTQPSSELGSPWNKELRAIIMLFLAQSCLSYITIESYPHQLTLRLKNLELSHYLIIFYAEGKQTFTPACSLSCMLQSISVRLWMLPE